MEVRDPSQVVASRVPGGGAWAVGVSGGADSVALLELLRHRWDLSLHVVHLDHETRGDASAGDAEFVRALAAEWGLACTIARRSEIERDQTQVPKNRSARYRVARLELFRRVVREHRLDGVLLAHHRDDQAETVFQRLLRGSGPAGMGGMAARTVITGVTVVRPLLDMTREALREMLKSRGIAWREDQSNESPTQQRNRVRRLLAARPRLVEPILELAGACRAWNEWLAEVSPRLGESFAAAELARLSPPVAREAARRWLARHAGSNESIEASAAGRLVEMASDAASASAQHFPGARLVRRRGGKIFIERPAK